VLRPHFRTYPDNVAILSALGVLVLVCCFVATANRMNVEHRMRDDTSGVIVRVVRIRRSTASFGDIPEWKVTVRTADGRELTFTNPPWRQARAGDAVVSGALVPRPEAPSQPAREK
jgi:hypothetical protein